MIRTEVDGVPALVAPASGPMRAGLVFRVGRADEILSRGGITHLVEHLALHGHGQTDYHFNGVTSAITTTFHMAGSEDDVVGFLGGVCRSLSALPVERVVTEKAILRTEAAGRSVGANSQMPLWRYGARGHGLVSYPEWGLAELTPEDLLSWAAHWFTRDNAVLWLAGSGIPAGLSLPLPGGQRRPVPPVTSALPVTPAFFSCGSDVVVLDSVVRRSTAASVYAGVLERELFRALRQEGGYSYTASTSYDPRDADHATVTALADSLPDTRYALIGGFTDVLMKLKAGRIEQADINAVRAKAEDSLSHPDASWGRIATSAVGLLTGHRDLTLAELRAELHAVTAEDVHGVAVQAMESALLMVPDGCDAEWAGFDPAPLASESAVTGRSYQSLEEEDVRLVAGPEGLSFVTPGGASTVRFAECAAVLAWPDGARRLVGNDGIVLHVEPQLLEGASGLTGWLDSVLSPVLRVARPERDPNSVPKPPTPAERKKTAKAAAAPNKNRATLAWALLGVIMLACVVVLVAIDPAHAATGVVRLGIVMVVVSVVGGFTSRRRT